VSFCQAVELPHSGGRGPEQLVLLMEMAVKEGKLPQDGGSVPAAHATQASSSSIAAVQQ